MTIDLNDIPVEKLMAFAESIKHLPEEQQKEIAKLPLSYAVFLYPDLYQYGLRFYIWRDYMDELERRMDARSDPFLKWEMYRVYHTDALDKPDSSLWRLAKIRHREESIIFTLPSRPKNTVYDRIEKLMDNPYWRDEKLPTLSILSLASTLLLAEDMVPDLWLLNQWDERADDWKHMIQAHHRFCVANNLPF